MPDATPPTGLETADSEDASGMPRRQFLRAAAGEAASTGTAAAASVARAQSGLLAEARQLAAAAGIGLSDPMVAVGGPAGAAGWAGEGSGSAGAPGATPTTPAPSLPYRSPYRVETGAVIVVDQRRLPGALVDVPCLHAGNAASAIGDGLAQGPGTIAAVGAYGLARGAATRAAAFRSAAAPDPRPLDALYADANLILAAAPWVVPLRRALDRLVARAEAATSSAPPPVDIAAELQTEADAFVMEQLSATSLLVGEAAQLIRATAERRLRESTTPRDPREPLRILVHGPVGALSFGQLGTAVGAVHAAAAAGVPLFVWVAEGRPPLSGVRTAWELSLAGVGHGLVPDSAVGGLLASSVDLVLTGALGVTANGDVVDEPGAYAIAALAARHDVPVYACVLGSMLFSTELQPTARFDVTPADLVTGFVTDAGILRPPFGPALAELSAGGGSAAWSTAGAVPTAAAAATAAADGTRR